MQSIEHNVTLRDGTRCFIRLCTHAGDRHDMDTLKAGIRSAWSHLSPKSRYQRFGYVPGQLSGQQLDYLADLDNKDRLAWCAGIRKGKESTGIGLARYIRLDREPDVAEFAITVVDEYQHSGLGSHLLAHLIDTARAAGLKILRGYVQKGNSAMIALGKKFGGIEYHEDDWLRIDIPVMQVASGMTSAHNGSGRASSGNNITGAIDPVVYAENDKGPPE